MQPALPPTAATPPTLVSTQHVPPSLSLWSSYCLCPEYLFSSPPTVQMLPPLKSLPKLPASIGTPKMRKVTPWSHSIAG